MINLVGIDLGGAEAPVETGGGGGTPTPPLPSAGKPYVAREDFSFDSRTHVVTLRARVADAGEVKAENVVGDYNYFPIADIPIALKGIIHRYNMIMCPFIKVVPFIYNFSSKHHIFFHIFLYFKVILLYI